MDDEFGIEKPIKMSDMSLGFQITANIEKGELEAAERLFAIAQKRPSFKDDIPTIRGTLVGARRLQNAKKRAQTSALQQGTSLTPERVLPMRRKVEFATAVPDAELEPILDEILRQLSSGSSTGRFDAAIALFSSVKHADSRAKILFSLISAKTGSQEVGSLRFQKMNARPSINDLDVEENEKDRLKAEFRHVHNELVRESRA